MYLPLRYQDRWHQYTPFPWKYLIEQLNCISIYLNGKIMQSKKQSYSIASSDTVTGCLYVFVCLNSVELIKAALTVFTENMSLLFLPLLFIVGFIFFTDLSHLYHTFSQCHKIFYFLYHGTSPLLKLLFSIFMLKIVTFTKRK